MKVTPNAALVLLGLVACSCATPTLQQRQAAWVTWQGSVRATCLVGAAKDPTIPDGVKLWCREVVGP